MEGQSNSGPGWWKVRLAVERGSGSRGVAMGGNVWSGGRRRWKEMGSDASRHRSEVRRGIKRKWVWRR